MKGTNFRRILCILIAAMLCIGLLPIGAAADSYAAAAELRSMQKVRREIDGELLNSKANLTPTCPLLKRLTACSNILTEIHESRASTGRTEQLSATL